MLLSGEKFLFFHRIFPHPFSSSHLKFSWHMAYIKSSIRKAKNKELSAGELHDV